MSQIKVIITDETGGTDSVSSSSTKQTSTTISNNGSIKSKKVKESEKESKSLAVASMITNQTYNYMTSNVGKWTGSTQTQTQVNNINNVMQIVGISTMSYVSPVVAIANVGINLATTAISTSYEQKWDSYQKEYNRLRVGELKGRGR